jgi:hypothetical protein
VNQPSKTDTQVKTIRDDLADRPNRAGRWAWLVFPILDGLAGFFGSSYIFFPSQEVISAGGTGS